MYEYTKVSAYICMILILIKNWQQQEQQQNKIKIMIHYECVARWKETLKLKCRNPIVHLNI